MKDKPTVEPIYKYNGSGLGVPGLPHEITRAEAERLGVLGLLDACIERGIYQKIEVKNG